MDAIRRYYLLCTQSSGGKAHVINSLPPDKISVVFTRKEIELYLGRVDGALIARESVVGGDTAPAIIIG